MRKSFSVRDLCYIAIMTAVIAVCAFIVIPLPGGVPFTLQTWAILLAGMILGPKKGVVAVLIYILLGLVGVPIFHGGRSGLEVLAGPTGGFLISFPLLAFAAGLRRAHTERRGQMPSAAANAPENREGDAGNRGIRRGFRRYLNGLLENVRSHSPEAASERNKKARSKRTQNIILAAAMIAATIVNWTFGMTWFVVVMSSTFATAFAATVAPFILPDLFKIIAAIIVGRRIQAALSFSGNKIKQ
ncbi:MAG: biotin transporter BioY [Defluviitaleaceae bacterium]|nr:biotin transporter BioY [Defluviitaleaceae bacterium]